MEPLDADFIFALARLRNVVGACIRQAQLAFSVANQRVGIPGR
jgi:hypothetical protein